VNLRKSLVARQGSYPFISGDSFRSDADFVLDRGDPPYLAKIIPPLKGNQVVFCELDFLSNPQSLGEIVALGKKSFGLNGGKPALVLHNGDFPPNPEQIAELLSSHWRVFCPNLVEPAANTTALPVGLENLHHEKNGLVTCFLKRRELNQKMLPEPPRSFEIFCSFNVSTNPNERELVAQLVRSSRHKFWDKQLRPSDFKDQISKSFFVLSPPGNGLDCHRTWEAIYLGAVPIIRRGTLSASLAGFLPVWEVDDWEDALNASPAQLWEVHAEKKIISSRLAYYTHWQSLIRDGK